MTRKQIYIGFEPFEQRYRVFKSDIEPTTKSHGAFYSHVIGPFRTLRGAHFMIDYGRGNPHCQTVSDAEHLAKVKVQNDWLAAEVGQ